MQQIEFQLTEEIQTEITSLDVCISQNGEPTQQALFSDHEVIPWAAEWQNMPEYYLENLEPKYQIIINFACAADVEDFGNLIGQRIKANENSRQLQSVWFPEQEIGRMINKRYIQK
jgi:hypothetical protein